MDQTKEIDIDLKKIFFMMRKKVVYILLFTLLGGIAAGCFTEFFIDQKYTAKISLYVYSDMNQHPKFHQLQRLHRLHRFGEKLPCRAGERRSAGQGGRESRADGRQHH